MINMHKDCNIYVPLGSYSPNSFYSFDSRSKFFQKPLCTKICGNFLFDSISNLNIWENLTPYLNVITFSITNSISSTHNILVNLQKHSNEIITFSVLPGNTHSKTINNLQSIFISYSQEKNCQGTYTIEICLL
ncbi:S-Ena type endospore appendage [Bacillus cereus]|uniref:S-Ena type endospore appendage n=1 Tax=Bacillus cereus TaxID=1396 RepID=UPI00404132E4